MRWVSQYFLRVIAMIVLFPNVHSLCSETGYDASDTCGTSRSGSRWSEKYNVVDEDAVAVLIELVCVSYCTSIVISVCVVDVTLLGLILRKVVQISLQVV